MLKCEHSRAYFASVVTFALPAM